MACRKEGVDPAQRFRFDRLRDIGSTGCAFADRGLLLDLRACEAGRSPRFRQWWHRCLQRLCPFESASSRPRPASSSAWASARKSRRGMKRGSRCLGEVGELVLTAPFPAMPVFPAERRRRQPDARELFRQVSRHLESRRLDSDRRHGGPMRHPRPLRRHTQPRRRAHGHGRILRHRRDHARNRRGACHRHRRPRSRRQAAALRRAAARDDPQ